MLHRVDDRPRCLVAQLKCVSIGCFHTESQIPIIYLYFSYRMSPFDLIRHQLLVHIHSFRTSTLFLYQVYLSFTFSILDRNTFRPKSSGSAPTSSARHHDGFFQNYFLSILRSFLWFDWSSGCIMGSA